MRRVSIRFQTDDSEIEYLIDNSNDSYKVLSKKIKDNNIIDELVIESGEVGSADSRQEIAKRIYYTILTSMKNDRG